MNTKPHSHQDDPADAAHKPVPKSERTLSNHPADPNRSGAGRQFPPGLDPEDARDPGRATPDAPPTDNRS